MRWVTWRSICVTLAMSHNLWVISYDLIRLFGNFDKNGIISLKMTITLVLISFEIHYNFQTYYSSYKNSFQNYHFCQKRSKSSQSYPVRESLLSKSVWLDSVCVGLVKIRCTLCRSIGLDGSASFLLELKIFM